MTVNKNKPSIVIVLGMHRSGTSALTNFISTFGFDAGDNLMPANNDNLKGYWEDLDIFRLNNEILSFLFLTWDQVEDFSSRKIDTLNTIVFDKFSEKAHFIISEKLNQNQRIIIKDPRITILLPFWNKVFDQFNINKYYILSIRNPLDVAKSLENRNNLSLEESLSLWYYYNSCCLNDNSSSLLIVHFEELIKNTQIVQKRVLKFLNINDENLLDQDFLEVIDHSIVNNKSNSDELDSISTFCPELVNFYQELLKTEIINERQKESYNKFCNTFQKIEHLNTLTSSLFYSGKSNSQDSSQFVQQIHSDGEACLLFDLPSNNNAEYFNLFLCDKPCIVKIKKLTLFTLNEKFEINEIEGNYLFKENSSFIFNTNTPELKFSSNKKGNIRTIELNAEIITSPNLIASFIIPLLIDRNDKLCEEKQYIENQSNNIQKGFDEFKQNHELLTEKFNKLSLDFENNSDLLEKIKDELRISTLKIIDAEQFIDELSAKKKVIEESRNQLKKQLSELENLNIKLSEECKKSEYLFSIRLENEKETTKDLKAKNETLASKNHQLHTKLAEFEELNTYLFEEQKKLNYIYSIKLDNKKEIIKQLEDRNAILSERNSSLEGINLQLKSLLSEHEIVKANFAEEQKKSEYLYALKFKNEKEIAELNYRSQDIQEQLSAIKKSISWNITWPFRFIVSLLISPFVFMKPFIKDIQYGIELLQREGLKKFVYRSWWYIRGKRLNEDIYLYKNKIKKTSSIITDSTIPIAVPSSDHPLVSIIIPVYNQWDYTYNCIKSIIEHTKDVPYEIIVADDVSTDETQNISKIIKNIHVIRNKKNLKFVLNNNNAAKKAKGKYIHFLNNDTVVHPNWLRSLVDVLESDENVGIVGSKLLCSDGRLQEAGGIIWNDASGWNYGRLDDPEKPDYNYLRETDYVSGASLLIRKSLWDQLGGFDELFVPAYYEDTDLAFRTREAGYKVIYQPLSVITHYEGISNGKELTEGLKKYQVENGVKFRTRWNKKLLEEHFTNSEHVFLAKDRSRTKKHILVIDHYVPHFDKDAGSRSTYSYLCLLVNMGYKVTFIGDNYFKHEPYTTILQQKGIEVLYGNYYFNNNQKWLKENGKYFDFIFCHRLHIAPKYFDVLKKYTKAKLIYIGHDLNFMGLKRKYEVTGNLNDLEDANKFKLIEESIFNTVDIILPFSTVETDIIRKIVPDKITETIPVYFYSKLPENIPGYIERNDLLFVGGFGHPPNVDAIIWFVNEIFPIVLDNNPEIKLYIVGSNPTTEISKLSSDSIIVTGYVDDKELEDYYYKCRLAVIPLRMGAGVKGKLLESLYYQIPAVITPVAAEGIPDIINYCTIVETPSSFAEKITLLYNDIELWSRCSKNCHELIQDIFSEEKTKIILNRVLSDL